MAYPNCPVKYGQRVTMHPEGHEDRLSRRDYAAVIMLFSVGIAHRLVQLVILYPQISEHVVDKRFVMQLLPEAIWRDHFWAGLLYLQQSPPIPNLFFAAIVRSFDSAPVIAAIFVGLQALLVSCTAGAMLCLLRRLGFSLGPSMLLSVIFLFSGDLIVMEYSAYANFFYEQSTMLLCLLSCLAALSYSRDGKAKYLVWLGLCVATLALTRSTFSYFSIPVFFWIIYVYRKNGKSGHLLKLLLSFLLPILALHGSWVAKNYFYGDYFSIATSTWGGANARTGDIRRQGAEPLLTWLEQREDICDAHWISMVKRFQNPIFFFPPKKEFLSHSQPAEVLARNKLVADARGDTVFFDTETFRLYSQCLEKIYVRYWMSEPSSTMRGVWASYQLFWFPIREFAARNPVPLTPMAIQDQDNLRVSLWLQRAIEELAFPHAYRFTYPDFSNFPDDIWRHEDTTVLAIPSIPLIIHTINFLALHSLPILILVLYVRNKKAYQRWTGELSFMLLCYLYVAGLCNLVEYGENMRFRLEVEPIIWVLSATIIRQYYELAMAARVRKPTSD